MTSTSKKESPPMAMELRAHVVDKILPSLVADGVLGQDVSVVGHDVSAVGGFGEDHWMSCTFRVTVDLQDRKQNVKRTERLVVKYSSQDEVWCDPAVAVHNEEVMYNQVVPFFEVLWSGPGGANKEPLGLFAKSYRVDSGRPVLVMEDLTARGFRLASSRCALDGAHVFLALQHLGKLHALSYTAKIRRSGDFMSLARQLGEPEYRESARTYQSGFLNATASRGLRRLAARGDGVIDASTVELLRRRLRSDRDSSPMFDAMVDARSAEEPLAVIAHGDFNRNNMMFKYDEASGRPVDVVFFDLQNAKYCSPVVDLSLFLFLNTTPSQRSAHWDDFFLAYYDGLSTTMRRLLSNGSDPTLSPTMDMPSLASLRADFARHALYGFAICSYFLPLMQQSKPADSCLSVEEYTQVAGSTTDKFESGRAVGASFASIGGEAGDDTIADLLLELVDRGLVGA